MPSQQSPTWCTFQARQDASIIIEYVVIASQITIFSFMIYALLKAKRQKQLDRLSIVYKFILAWLFCFFFKTLVNIVAYFVYIQKSSSNVQQTLTEFNNLSVNQEDEVAGLKVLSGIFLLLDISTTFILQLCMMYIPYLWMKNALALLSDQLFIFQQRKAISRIYYFLEIIKKYLIFRNIYILGFIALTLILIVGSQFEGASLYTSIISIIEAFIILSIYILGLKTLWVIKNKIKFVQNQKKSILTEYAILLVCNAIRIILNSTFYWTKLVSYEPDRYCYDNHSKQQTLINCIYLSVGLGLMHILPGFMILYIYWPTKKSTDLKVSLLISASQNIF